MDMNVSRKQHLANRPNAREYAYSNMSATNHLQNHYNISAAKTKIWQNEPTSA